MPEKISVTIRAAVPQDRIRRIGRDHVGNVVAGIDELPAQSNEQQDDRHFNKYDHGIDGRRLLGTANEQQSQQSQDHQCRGIHHTGV